MSDEHPTAPTPPASDKPTAVADKPTPPVITMPPPAMPDAPVLVQTDAVSKYFRTAGGLFSRQAKVLRAVESVSLSVRRGETMALVGESGSGKSTLGRLILRLHDPSSGRIFFDGTDITRKSANQLRPLRKRMQVIFQDPYSSLNPRMTVEQTLAEPLRIHKLATSKAEERRKIEELLERVGLRGSTLERYPHEFSGGQRQRIGIARALSVGPEFIVCDEPVSALDVSIQAQIINLLLALQNDLGLSYLFISHDLRVVRHMSHRVAVMYLGQIVEQAPALDLYARPRHPYTKVLLEAAPSLDTAHEAEEKRALPVVGELPSPFDPPKGCAFHPRCARMEKGKCDVDAPSLTMLAPAHKVACFFPLET